MDDENCSPGWSATVSVVQESIVVSGWSLVVSERKCMNRIRDSNIQNNFIENYYEYSIKLMKSTQFK